jgi:gluconolactonase
MDRIPEILAEGLAVPEGPVWCDDGTIVLVAVGEGLLYRVFPEQRRKEILADTGGGPNAAAPASDGNFLITQNGGLDFKALGAPAHWPDPRFTAHGLQVIRPDGAAHWLLQGMQAPNDLIVGPDNTIYFTDPRKHPVPDGSTDSRVMALSPAGELRLITDGLHFCNGIVREADGNLLITEANGLMRIHQDGRKEWIIETLSEKHATDGMCLDADGRVYMAAGWDAGIRIIEDGREVDFMPFPDGILATNCCFGGPENKWLIATDGLKGTVLLWRNMPYAGLPLHSYRVPQTIG